MKNREIEYRNSTPEVSKEDPFKDWVWADWIYAVAIAGGYDTNELLKQIKKEGVNTTYPKDLS